MVQLTFDVNLGVIVTALAPVLAVIVVAKQARKDARIKEERRELVEAAKDKKIEEIHTMINSQATTEKKKWLDNLKAWKLVVEKLFKDETTDDHRALLINMEQQIRQLSKEVDKREGLEERIKAASRKKEKE